MPVSTDLIARQIMDAVPPIMRTIRRKWKEGPIFGISNSQFHILMFIRKRPGAALQDVAHHLGLTPATTSTTVDELVNNQLVLREPSADDRRKITLTLTEQGQEILEKVFEQSRKDLAAYLSPLTPEDAEIIFQALNLLGPLFSSHYKKLLENT